MKKILFFLLLANTLLAKNLPFNHIEFQCKGYTVYGCQVIDTTNGFQYLDLESGRITLEDMSELSDSLFKERIKEFDSIYQVSKKYAYIEYEYLPDEDIQETEYLEFNVFENGQELTKRVTPDSIETVYVYLVDKKINSLKYNKVITINNSFNDCYINFQGKNLEVKFGDTVLKETVIKTKYNQYNHVIVTDYATITITESYALYTPIIGDVMLFKK
jgi:hypothetical protein